MRPWHRVQGDAAASRDGDRADSRAGALHALLLSRAVTHCTVASVVKLHLTACTRSLSAAHCLFLANGKGLGKKKNGEQHHGEYQNFGPLPLPGQWQRIGKKEERRAASWGVPKFWPTWC